MSLNAAKKTSHSSSAYQEIADALTQEMQKTNEIIIQRLDSHVDIIPTIAAHLIAAGGKRIRPLLALASAKLCQGDMSRAIPLAACIEFIHTATLLHDDVIDESSTRRGQASANAVWGNQSSVLVGDFLFGRSFELMVEDGHLDVLKILSRVSTIIIEGEMLQHTSSYDLETAKRHYLDIIRSKTGALFSAATEVGAAVSAVDLEKRKAMADFGMNLGMAFQCVDDLLDYFADEATMGKQPGDDYREGKITLPVILAYEKATLSEKEFWQRAFSEVQEIPFEEVKTQMHKTGVYQDVLKRADDFTKQAIAALHQLPDSPLRRQLEDFAHYCVERAY